MVVSQRKYLTFMSCRTAAPVTANCAERKLGAPKRIAGLREKPTPDVPRRWIAARQPVHVGEADGVEHDRRRTEIAGRVAKAAASVFRPFMRSEEHTSELQSLMRTS